jgi:hypothetical protein
MIIEFYIILNKYKCHYNKKKKFMQLKLIFKLMTK